MFKTIFGKMLVIFISILIFSFSVTGMMLYIFLGNFVLGEKQDALKQSGDRINSLLKIYIENPENPAARLLFERILESYSSNTNSYVWIVDKNGYIAFAQPELPDIVKERLKSENGYVKLPDDRQYKKVMQGVQDNIREIGDFYGLFKDTGISWLTVEKPFKNTNSQGKEEVIAAVYLHTPIPELHKARTSVFKLFIIAVFISVFISILLVYIFSLKITSPLKEIRNASKIIAGGEFQKRLDIKSNDEIGELASSFNHMASALQNLEEMRRGFIANVSHELRTPMTSIRGFIEGILDGTIPAERHRDYLNIVKDETNRLNRLVNDLLDLARMEAGEVVLNYKEFDINELIRRCIIKLENLIVQKGLQFEASFEEEGMMVYADPDAIERVIINLVHNAVKFTPEGGKIKINTQNHKGKIYVSVKDSGIGISKEELELIWERFYKSDKSRGGDKTGTGLGLAIVKNIMNEHKQEIWVDSEQGEGTEFTFTLESLKK